ncbi:MAG: aldose 1-epimerase family protein, partial [Acutalibacteraceae bacterium]|nr:aldose 1-epimerase family protein [Acutalibacteraceae bacterium]
MYYKIENDFLTCEIDDMGAQLHSLILKENGKEYIWQGNPDIWYGQAPVLFPVIGQLINDKFRYNGVEYTMPKHGLARKLLFNVKECAGAKAVFSLESNEDTLKSYPFDFEYLVSFELKDKALINTMIVINKTSGEMYFSVGAHPAFN